MVFLTFCGPHNQQRDIICLIDGCFQIICNSCYRSCENSIKNSFGIILNEQLLSFFIKLTQQVENIMKLWIEGLIKNGVEYLYVLECSKDNCQLSLVQCDKLKLIGIRSVEKYQLLMRNNRQFVINHHNSEIINHPQFFKDVHNLIFKNWINNASIFINNFQQILKEDVQLSNKLSIFAIKIKQHLYYEMQAIKMRMLAKYQKMIILNQKNSVRRHSQQQQQKQNNCPNSIIISNKKISLPLFLNEIKQIESCLQIEQPKEQGQQKNKIRSIQTLKSFKTINFLSQQIQSMAQQNKTLIDQNTFLKNQNQSLYQDNKILMAKIQKMRYQQHKPKSSSNKKQRLDSQLLQQVIQLQVQITEKNKDIQILINFINKCIEDGHLDKQIVNLHCKKLKTLHIDI